jgi:hypothetical protein
MQGACESRVLEGLNDYRFKATLHVEHPSISPDEATATLALSPTSVRRNGEPRILPNGSRAEGAVRGNYWAAELEITPGRDIPAFLLEFVDGLPVEVVGWMRKVSDTGGSVSVFLGIFADGLCDFEIPPGILRKLGDAGVTTRFDFYGKDKHAEQSLAAESR